LSTSLGGFQPTATHRTPRRYAEAIAVLILLAAPAQAELHAQKIMSAARPTTLVSPPADPRLFVVEQLTGRVLLYEAGSVKSTPFLTIDPASMRPGVAEGFLGMDFDPEYATNGRFYTFSIQDEPVVEQACPSLDPGRVVVRRYEVSAGDADVAEASSGVEILGFDNYSSGHHAGWWTCTSPENQPGGGTRSARGAASGSRQESRAKSHSRRTRLAGLKDDMRSAPSLRAPRIGRARPRVTGFPGLSRASMSSSPP
jgi:hypothetical protein